VTSPIPQRVLVYDRIAQNRTKTTLLVGIALLSIVPFIGAIGFGVYALLGRVAFYTQPLMPGYQSPIDRMREFYGKMAAMPPQKWAKLEPEYERLYKAQMKLLGEWRSGQGSGEAFQQEYARLNQEQERLQTEAERLVDPEGVKRREERQKADASSQILLTVGVTFCLAAALAVMFWGIVRSPGAKALAFCGARPAGRSEAENEAKRLVENLAIGAGLPPPKLWVIDSMAPNAFAAGMDPEHSTVAVTSGLLKLLDTRELEGVLAHELAHIGNRDTRLSTAVLGITLFLRLPKLLAPELVPKGRRWETQSLTEMTYRFRLGNMVLRAVGIPVYLYIFVVAPFVAAAIRAAISRGREALADADAALLTRYPEGLLRALAKISGAGSVVDASNPIVSHLFFADPSAAGIGVGFFSGSMLSSHPPIEERIRRLLEFGANVPPSAVEEARKAGEAFVYDNPARTVVVVTAKPPQDELTALANAETRHRVFRLLGTSPVALYERDDGQSRIVAKLAPGTCLVCFDYRTKMRQVLTPNQTFGYIPRAAMLEAVAMTPEEAFHAAAAAPAVSFQPRLAPMAVAAAVATAQGAAPPRAAQTQPATQAPAQEAAQTRTAAEARLAQPASQPATQAPAQDPAQTRTAAEARPAQPASQPVPQAPAQDAAQTRTAAEARLAQPAPQPVPEPPTLAAVGALTAATPHVEAQAAAPAKAPPGAASGPEVAPPPAVQPAVPRRELSASQAAAAALVGLMVVGGILAIVFLVLRAMARH
jgi:heat shock protein HtpX